MSRILSILDEAPDEPWLYYELAQLVYEVREPTRAQLSAVGRAVGRLVEQGEVERWSETSFGDDWARLEVCLT